MAVKSNARKTVSKSFVVYSLSWLNAKGKVCHADRLYDAQEAEAYLSAEKSMSVPRAIRKKRVVVKVEI